MLSQVEENLIDESVMLQFACWLATFNCRELLIKCCALFLHGWFAVGVPFTDVCGANARPLAAIIGAVLLKEVSSG